jgi:hypothetical protein
VFAPEEVFFATMLSLLGYLRDPVRTGTGKTVFNDQVLRQDAVYAEWAKRGDANPISFSDLTPDVLQRMKDKGCLLGRKFKNVSLNQWMKLVIMCDDPVHNDLSMVETLTQDHPDPPTKRSKQS